MAQKKPLLFYIAVVLVILSTLAHEAEARRKILRGRRVMTRTYYHMISHIWTWVAVITKIVYYFYDKKPAKCESDALIKGGNAVPAWAISLLSGIGMLIIGGVLYIVMRKIILSSETGSLNTYQPALQNEEV